MTDMDITRFSCTSPECADCNGAADEDSDCPAGARSCGHHCNHSWSHDCCCWCGIEWGEEPANDLAPAKSEDAS